MKGLRTQETSKFENFFSVVQETARREGCVFFLQAGDGNEFTTDTMEGEELMGWLVPNDKAEEFERLWMEKKETDDWTDFFRWAEWNLNGETVEVRFADY